MKKEKGKKNKVRFDYGQMRPVYTIIILENSYYQFLDYPDIWKHTGRVMFDSGIELDFLYNFIYVALDKFRELNENEEELFEIIRSVSIFCMDVERVLDMVSEALIEFDRGTEERMLEEAREEAKRLKKASLLAIRFEMDV